MKINEKQLKRYPNIYKKLEHRVNALVVNVKDEYHKIKWLNFESYYKEINGETLTIFELIK
tara:strand:+ start:1504 stop:1686 length:183 start_codon:yes stop_codon:yes gene_type:complete